ncbi:MAG: hypothetical protein WC010_03915 [Candidatus Absconditabacterales bacterium]
MRRKDLTPALSRMKVKLAEIAKNITIYKRKMKSFQQDLSKMKNDISKDSVNKSLNDYNKKTRTLSNSYRHMHIAYCELRGTSRNKIESKVRTAKSPLEYVIEEFKVKYSVTE